MVRYSRYLCMLLASTASGLTSYAARAQTVESGTDKVSAEAAPESGEIVVTAQRRAERYVDVPASISVVTEKQLTASGVTSSRDLRLLTPGLNITQQGTFAQPTIRGVGTTVTGTGADPNVAVYVDGVYQASQASALFEFNNIEQIETLKGPQGTLYGRNATGGAIVVTTKAPNLDKLSGNADISYGRFDEVRASAYLNVPVSSTVAFNIAAYNRSNDGYTRNVFLDERSSYTKSRGVRGRLLFEPSDDLRIILTGAHIFQSDNTAYSYVPINNNTPQRTSQAAMLGLTSRSLISLNTRPMNKLNYTSANLNIDWRRDWGTLTSISSYAYTKYPFATDLDATERPVQAFVASPQTQETETQELIYTSPKFGIFSLIGGLYYYHDLSITQARISVGGNPLPFPPFQPYAHVEANAYAAYAEGTVDLTSRLHLTAGGRYSVDKKHAMNSNGGANGFLLLDASKSFHAFTPRAALRFDVNRASSVYASYSQGFKSGLFDAGATGLCTAVNGPNCPSPGTPVAPEKVRAYEAGYKYNAGGTTFSFAGYYSQYRNIQINALNAINQQILYNAAAGEIYGAEAEATTRLGDNFSVHVGGAYTHGKYTRFPLAQNFIPLAAGGNKQVTGDDTGNRLIRTPRLTGFVSATYTQKLADLGKLESTFTASYSSSFFWTVDNRLKQPEFAIVNGRITWIAPSERWNVTIFGDNLTNRRTQLYVREAVVGDFSSFSKPRSYGVGVGVNF